MASSFKSSNSQRGRPYALMLLLAFGAAILGVMVLHKLREKRIFSLLVKEKDHELLTLHLLFQREKEFNKEARKKMEEMKSKVYSLRSQKLELDRRLLEMESIIASLRDERKVIESTLEEKKNEIKMLTEEGTKSSGRVFPQVAVLEDGIQKKEVEIEDLKHRVNGTDNDGSLSNVSETNSISDGARNRRQFYLDDSTGKETKEEGGSKLDSITEQQTEPATNVTRKHDIEDDEPPMRREAALYKWVDEQKESIDNRGIMTSKDENKEKKPVDPQIDQVPKVIERNNISTDHNPGDQDSRGLTNFKEDRQKLKENEAATELGFRGRRKHSRGKRLRDSARIRGSSGSLNAGTTETEDLHNQENKGEPKVQKEAGTIEEHATAAKSRNETQKVGSDGQVQANGEVAHDRVSVETQPGSTEVAKNLDDDKSGFLNAEGTTKHATASQSHDTETNRKLLKTQNMEANKYANDNGRGNEVDLEGEAEDSDDPETREPEIDMADIKRFAESDPDEEEADEAAEETEF